MNASRVVTLLAEPRKPQNDDVSTAATTTMKGGAGDMKSLSPTDQRGTETAIAAGAIEDTMPKTGMPATAMTNEQSVATGTITTDGVSAAGRGPRREQPEPRDVKEAADEQGHPHARSPRTKAQAQTITDR